MDLKLVMGLFGSGSHWPIGVFDNEEDMQRVIDECNPSSTIILDVPLNANYEFIRREQYKIAEAEQKIEDMKKEAWFDKLTKEGAVTRKGSYAFRHITFDGEYTLCKYKIGKGWREPNKPEHHREPACHICYERLEK